MQLARDNYNDYVGSMYFRACGVPEVKFTQKKVKVGEEEVTLIHVAGVQPETGLIVNYDMWPRDKVGEGDIIPEKVSDVIFRIGYHTETDLKTNTTTTHEGEPKWLYLIADGKRYGLSGGKREFVQ